MKTCVLDGATLHDAVAVYRQLADALGAPDYFGHNPDALWDEFTEYCGEPIEIVWKNSAQSAVHLESEYEKIVTVLQLAEQQGRVKLRME